MADISSLADLLSVVVTDVVPKFGIAWWRGQPAGKPLLPKVYRGAANRRMEWLRTAQFVQRAATRHHRVPNRDDASQWLFLMQHYGLPTRLLDWTESPLIACYFAVRENDGADACIWALAPENLNMLSELGAPDLVHPDVIKSYFELPFRQEDPPGLPQGVLAIRADEIGFRMLQQQSVFTIHGARTPMEALPEQELFLQSYRVPAGAKANLLKELLWMGIREAHLFPDLEHLATDLCRLIGPST